MALIDKYATPIDRLMVILQVLPIDKLRLVLRFAEFLQSKVQKGGKEDSEASCFTGAPT